VGERVASTRAPMTLGWLRLAQPAYLCRSWRPFRARDGRRDATCVRSSKNVGYPRTGSNRRDIFFLSRFEGGTRQSALRRSSVEGGDALSEERLPRLLDIEGVAEHLGVSERHVRRLVAERRIPFIKWGHLRFDPEAVGSWLDEARVPTGDDVTGSR
jgi:excisionase family DNA binding protein